MITRKQNVEVAVPVVIADRHAHPVAAASRDPCRDGDVLEPAIAQIPEEGCALRADEQDILPAIVVVVQKRASAADRLVNPYGPGERRPVKVETRGSRDVLKR